MAKKAVLTEKFINSPRRPKPPKGSRLDFHDALVPGMALRITDSGHASFVLTARYPSNPQNPTRRSLGAVGEIDLDDARDLARAWITLIKKGIDPRDEAKREKAADEEKLKAEDAKRRVTLTAVVEDFIREKLPRERKGGEVARSFRRDLLPKLGDRPIAEITRSEIRNLVKEKAREAAVQARNLLTDIKRLFGWALDEGNYGLVASPCADIKPLPLFGEKKSGERALDESEMYALWRAAGRLPFPYGQIYQLLALTALRLNEVVDASWPEFDFEKRLWTIPAQRMKGKEGKAKPHVVPLTQPILEVLASVPEFSSGPYLFSLTGGKAPVWVGSKIKIRLKKAMLRTLRALAHLRGDDPGKVTLAHFTNHDIRRSVRTGLSGLKKEHGIPIATEVMEAILAHAQPPLHGTYNKHDYLNEKQEALELWDAHLRNLARPRVVNLADKRRRLRREE